MSASDWPDPRSQIVAGRQPRGAPLQPAGKATDCCSWMAIVWAKGSMARYKRLLSGQKCAVVNDRHGGAFRPGSIGNRSGGVSDRISAKAGKQIARVVTNCRSVKGATGRWASRSSGPLVLKEER
jgi:hypothetical protein